MLEDYQWYIVAAFMIISFYIGVAVGIRHTTQEVLDIIEQEERKK